MRETVMKVYYSTTLDRLALYFDQIDGGYLSLDKEAHHWIECTPEKLGLVFIGVL